MDYKIPDNFMNLGHLRYQKIDFNKEADNFLDVLNSALKENDVQKYIKTNQKWFIPGSLFRNYDFGHHEAYLLSEPALGAEYRADYMLLGRNSIGYQIVLVEFEDVNIDYVLSSSNTEAESVRKGLSQIQDWKRWMDDNRAYFINSVGLSSVSGNIPSWGIYYCLVVGRRSRMNDIANEMRGQKTRETPGLSIVSYDRLVDNTRALINGF
jgi:hypothetical protein